MKNVYTTVLAALIISISTYESNAQQENSFGSFIASPVGKFKSTDLDEGGYAKQGWGLVFDSKSIIKAFPKGLTLYFHSTYQWNEMDTKAIEEDYTQYLGYRTEVSDSKYSPLLTTVGPSYEYELGKKFGVGINGTIGVIFNNTKAFTVKVFDTNGTQLISELVNFEDNVAFAYTFGAEVKYSLIPDVLGIELYGDYTAAKQKTEITAQDIEPTESFQSLQYFNTGLKLVFYTSK